MAYIRGASRKRCVKRCESCVSLIINIMKKNINKRPNNIPMLMTGAVLLVLSPFSGFFIPPLVERFTCAPSTGLDIYSCLKTDFWVGLAIGATVFIIGSVLIFLGLRLRRK